MRVTVLDPPILVNEGPGTVYALATVDDVIDFIRRYERNGQWEKLRSAAYIAAAVPATDARRNLRHETRFRTGT
jgi:hypothetical protein